MMRVVGVLGNRGLAMPDQEMHFLEQPQVAGIPVIARELNVAVVRHFVGVMKWIETRLL